MGWLFSPDWSTKQKMVEYLSDHSRFSEGYVHLKSSVVGNNHWYLLHVEAENKIIIGLDVIRSGGRDGYGYKSMTASMGPVEVDCPLTFLDKASDPDPKGFEPAWRERVIKYHEARNAKRKKKQSLEKEMVVTYDGVDYRLDYKAGPRRGWFVTRISDGQPFVMKAYQLGQAKIRGAAH